MFLMSYIFFVIFNIPFIATKVPWGTYFCDVPDWHCDGNIKREFEEQCLDDCLVYRYCARNKWCINNANINESISKQNIDLVIIEFSKFIPRCLIKNLPKLKTIYGKNRDIAFVEPSAFWNLPELEEINLSYNYIKGVHYGSFSKLSSVQSLDLSWNEIEYIGQGSFHGMTNLKRLDLSRNYINRFDAAYYFFLTNTDASLAVTELNLSHNKLRLVLNLNIFRHLTVVDLSSNELAIVNWTSNFRPSQWLTKLDLSDNVLFTLDMDILDVYIDKLRIPFSDFYHPDDINIMGTVNVIVLDGNIWQCEAYNQLLMKFAKMKTKILSYNEDDDIYFLTKFERENYPVCWFEAHGSISSRPILSLESRYKTRKNPWCRTKDHCPSDMFCKSGRCWKGCEQNICDETTFCVGDYHGFFCHCPKGKIRNPYTTDTRCYNVECFVDENCLKFGKVCDKKTHKCKPA